MKTKWMWIATGMAGWFLVFMALNSVPQTVGLLSKPLPMPTPTPPLVGFGALIAGVTAQEKADWIAGRVQFQVVETPATGLGPLFNQQSCQACHGQPQVNGKDTIGGAAGNVEVHFVSPTFGPDLFHLSSISPLIQDAIPTDSTVIVSRKSNQTAGLGLIEEIPDSIIIANAQTGQDGVFGRPAMLSDATTLATPPNRVGRLGWKSQLASTRAFASDALLNELGLTTRIPGRQVDLPPHVPNGAALLVTAEPAGFTPTALQDLPLIPALPEDPVTNPDRVDKLRNFLRFNAAPPTVPLTASALRGKAVFERIGCVRCHTESYQTGPAGGSAALAFKNVPLFSDLRLHHCGPVLGDGIPQGNAGPDEMRTAPLWGLRGRQGFLHDARAATPLAAIMAHDAPGAESQKIAQRFEHLPVDQKQDILDFLNSI